MLDHFPNRPPFSSFGYLRIAQCFEQFQANAFQCCWAGDSNLKTFRDTKLALKVQIRVPGQNMTNECGFTAAWRAYDCDTPSFLPFGKEPRGKTGSIAEEQPVERRSSLVIALRFNMDRG